MKTLKITLLTTLIMASISAQASICPEGFKQGERTIAIYKEKPGVKDSKKEIEKHFKNIYKIFKKKKVTMAAAYAYKKDDGYAYSMYAVGNKTKMKEYILMDKDVNKNRFNIELQTWYQCEY